MIKIFLLELLNISGSDPCICLVQTPCSSKTTVPEFYEYAKFETVIHLGCSGVLLLANTMFRSNSIADWQCFQTPQSQVGTELGQNSAALGQEGSHDAPRYGRGFLSGLQSCKSCSVHSKSYKTIHTDIHISV